MRLRRGAGAAGGDIATSEDKAYGVLAQSIGGNGASGGSVYSFNADLFSPTGMNVYLSVGGSGAGAVTGHTVYGISYGDIQAEGFYALGLFGQSIGALAAQVAASLPMA